MALTDGSAALQKRVAFAEKMRKAKKSDILKGKRESLAKKTQAESSQKREKESLSTLPTEVQIDTTVSSTACGNKPAIDMNELF